MMVYWEMSSEREKSQRKLISHFDKITNSLDDHTSYPVFYLVGDFFWSLSLLISLAKEIEKHFSSPVVFSNHHAHLGWNVSF